MSVVNIDNFWLEDQALARISRQTPSTPPVATLLRDLWPKMFEGLMSSETYRGCAAVFGALSQHGRMDVGRAEQIINSVDQSLNASSTLLPGTDGFGGAKNAIAAAWDTAHCGYTGAELAAAYESGLIYSAIMFQRARQMAA